jgi:Mn-dependent DtxR family transcriptional regulator
VLAGELELMGYVDVKDNKVTITDKGKKKLESFKASLTAEEREALKI